jgi:hypothetical protein
MKKVIIVLMSLAVALLAGSFFAPSPAQNPAKNEKPTFYRLTPGVYMNGWPRFTVTYPKDWVERLPLAMETFRAAAPGTYPQTFFAVSLLPPLPLDKVADSMLSYFKATSKEATIISDKPARLRDGTPAREVMIRAVRAEIPLDWLYLVMQKGGLMIYPVVASDKGKIGEDLKAILYSLRFQPGKDEPVKVPPDVQEFLDKFCSDVVSHDLEKIMTHYSDRYLRSGTKKGEMEVLWRQITGRVTSYEVVITDFEAAGDKAYLTGFTSAYWGKGMLAGISIIKENGEWKWYGNQRDPAP